LLIVAKPIGWNCGWTEGAFCSSRWSSPCLKSIYTVYA